jgi:molybdopterin-guanine dinucleotide biosynthesis protein A
VIIGAGDASLTPNAGLAAVSELVEHLKVAAMLDAGIGPLKQRDRGIHDGELLVSLACCHLTGGHHLVSLDRLRADLAGQELVSVPTPVSTTAAGVAGRFTPERPGTEYIRNDADAQRIVRHFMTQDPAGRGAVPWPAVVGRGRNADRPALLGLPGTGTGHRGGGRRVRRRRRRGGRATVHRPRLAGPSTVDARSSSICARWHPWAEARVHGDYPRGVGIAAGVVLAGGRSTRMGTAKAGLEWHGSTLLYRTAAVMTRSVDGPVVVVAAPGQELPDLPDGVAVVADPVEGLGPMQGLAVGLAAVADRAEVAFVCSTDLPFLHPAYVRRVLREFGDGVDVVLPVARGFRQPLAAGYRTGLAGLVVDLLRQGNLRPGMIFQHCVAARLDDAALVADTDVARYDPDLESVVNVNTSEDYQAARDRQPPEVVVERFGVLAKGGGHRPRAVRAATIGHAAAAVGVMLDRHVVAAVNGDQVTRDGRLPLVAGDTVAFLSADAGG